MRRLPTLPRPRSAVAFTRIVRDAAFDSGGRAEAELAREFAREDPWGYETPEGRRRFERELGLVEFAARGGRIGMAFEIGCGEGHFTEILAPRCELLLAVDVNSTALERARRRCRDLANVRFQHWDLRSDGVPDRFDLVVATSVLEYLKSPLSLWRARAKLVQALRPGGVLLLGNVRLDPVVENARWARILPRGAGPVDAFMSRHPRLDVVAHASANGYLETVFVAGVRR